MTETTSTKPMWTRCPGCKDRVYNDQLDIGIHRGHCPADLQRKIQDLDRRLRAVDKRLDELDEDLAIEPAVDPDAIAPWTADDDLLEEPDEATDVEEDADVESPFAAITTIPTPGLPA